MEKNSVDKDCSSQEKIEILEKKYAKVREHQAMEIIFNAAMEYLTEKGQENNGS
ncbi:MAG: hypothetical protein GY737_29020 [Desulfobacteraceae bacterium]|nr:hypothetical protein [Desulfobacteraceae bacterium]